MVAVPWRLSSSTPPGLTGNTPVVNGAGFAVAATTLTSSDQNVAISIPMGAQMLDSSGNPLTSITCTKTATMPAPPEDKVIVTCYDFGPSGATFKPGITITLKFNPSDLPQGSPAGDLKVAFWDGSAWQMLDASSVDTQANTVSVVVTHFTSFAVLGAKPTQPTTAPVTTPPPEPETAPPAPAAFAVSELLISPAEVVPGQTVAISVLVINTGGNSGNCELVLAIDGQKEVSREITLSPKASERETFTTTKQDEKLYAVNVNGTVGSFEVRQIPVPLPEVESFSVTPKYDAKSRRPISVTASFQAKNITAMATLKPVLDVEFNGKPLEAVAGVSQSVGGNATGSWDYTPSAGWQSGTYTFYVELTGPDGILCRSEEQNLFVAPSAAVVNWSVLLVVLSSALFVSGILLSILVYGKRRMYKS